MHEEGNLDSLVVPIMMRPRAQGSPSGDGPIGFFGHDDSVGLLPRAKPRFLFDERARAAEKDIGRRFDRVVQYREDSRNIGFGGMSNQGRIHGGSFLSTATIPYAIAGVRRHYRMSHGAAA